MTAHHTILHHTILMIDDSPEDHALIRRFLQRYQTTDSTLLYATTGEQGLALWRTEAPTCILLDYSLPDIDGLEVLAQIVAASDHLRCPVVILTGRGNERVAVQALQQGVHDYLVKDGLTPDALCRAIDNAIEKFSLQNRLRDSEQRYQNALENMMDCFGIYSAVRDTAGRILDFRIEFVNAAACRANFLAREDQVGELLCEVLPAHRESGLFDAYCRVTETGAPLQKLSCYYEDHYDGKRGKLARAFDIRAWKMDDGFAATWRDVTEQKRQEQALRDSEARFRRLMDANVIGVAYGDAHGSFTDVNAEFARITGYTHDELVSGALNWLDITPSEYLEISIKAVEQMQASGVGPVIERDILRKDGSRAPILIAGAAVEGEQLAHFNIVLDRSEQKRQQTHIEELNARLTRAMAESHHRIKNNLQMLYALVEMQLGEGDTVPTTALKRIGDHIRSLASLHDMLTTEAKAGGDMDTVRMQAALDKLISLLPKISEQRIVVDAHDIRLTPKQSVAVTLLINELISNASKHGQGHIILRLWDEGETARLEVCDNGPGFPPGFDPRTSANTGLELIESISRWDLKGQTDYYNRSEGGACVRIIFPLTDEPHASLL